MALAVWMDGWMEGGREEGGLCSTPTFIYNMAAILSVLATPPSAARLRLLLALFGLHLCQFLQTNWLLLTSFLLAGSEAPSPILPTSPRPPRKDILHRESFAHRLMAEAAGRMSSCTFFSSSSPFSFSCWRQGPTKSTQQ